MQIRKQQLELDKKQLNGSNLGKKYNKAAYYLPAYLPNTQSTSWEMPGWMNHKLEPRLSAEISIIWYYADDTTLMAESEEELKSLLMKVKEESEKDGLKTKIHGIQSHHFMANRWGNSGQWQTLFSWAPITADGDCSHEIKRCLLLGRKAMNNLDSIFKSRDITLPTKVRLVKALAFLVVMYGCENWTVKKAEHRKTDAFELWC